ncbi:MAG TPA: M56 family metallopeptidase [Planctomycetaceae bacterium]|jgi:beta-lactamase regulating signal transducer with metallopeptidase domain|nr:M56 family metallopeptidase [Planctomycetaceae bacterium]
MGNELSSFAPATLTLASTYLLHSTLLLGGAWLAVRSGRIRSETLKERLWKLAAVLALLTAPLQLSLGVSSPTLELAFGGARTFERPGDAVVTPVASAVERSPSAPIVLNETARAEPNEHLGEIASKRAAAPVANEFIADRATRTRPPIMSETSDNASAVTSVGETAPARPVLARIAGVLIVFFCAGILRLVCQTILLSVRLKDCEIVHEPSVCRLLEQIAQRGGVRRKIRLLVSPTFRQPAAFGAFRWTIVLPEEVVRTFESSELFALLAHEAAHLVRGDAVWLWWGRVLCSCLAFQPLNFLARRGWRRSAEILCDEWAVTHSASGLALARCLTRVAEASLPAGPRLQALWALGSPSHLSERVERLVNGGYGNDAWTTRARSRFITLAGVGIATVFVWAAPRTTILADVAQPLSAARIERLDLATRTDIDLLGADLRELTAEIDEVSDLVKWRLPANRPATDLATRISAQASELRNRYEKFVHAAEPRSDTSAEANP